MSAITFGKLEGFTRIIFYFEGALAPGCQVGYDPQDDPGLLTVRVMAVSVTDPWVAGVFDAGGYLDTGLGSVLGVDSGDFAGGSGEWDFHVEVTGYKPFVISAVTAPSRLLIDIQD